MEVKSWLLFAVIAMVLVSVSNIITKALLNDLGSEQLNLDILSKLNVSHYLMLGAILILSIVSAVAFISAINAGKPALVMAVVSLSTVLMAVLSVVFLHDQFTTKEMIGMALATISIIILAG